MERRALKNKRERLRRGKKTLVKQAHKPATVHNIDHSYSYAQEWPVLHL